MTGYLPKHGFDWNPLRKHRNIDCPCGSKKKAKKCHGLAEILPISDIKKINGYLKALSAAGMVKVSIAKVEKSLKAQR